MHKEQYVVPHPAGIHHATLQAFCNHFRPGMVSINGWDPTSIESADVLDRVNHNDPVEITAETGDPQTDRDAVHIAQALISKGRDPWQVPGQRMSLPLDRYNQAANYVRENWLGLPTEHHGTLSKWRLPVSVSSEMSVTSQWRVVALGELQQPGGVGATMDYNPVVDGINPEGPEVDNASNSPEQEVAMQTWVNQAVDLLNRGEDVETIIAKLAHDGCPNPQEIIQRAQQQPMEEQAPVSDSIGQDAFQNPPPADQTGEMQGLSQQPPVMAGRVLIAGTTMTGTEIDRWEGLWGNGVVKVALDGGGTIEVDPTALEPVSAQQEGSVHPVSEIQQFIDSMPPVEPSRPHIEARLHNLELVRRAVRANISKVALSDQVELQAMDVQAADETALLKEALSNLVERHELNYVAHSAINGYRYNAFDVATPEIKAWAGRPREAGAIWASENFVYQVDKDEFTSVAAHYASSLGLTGSQFEEFLAGAFEDGLKNLLPVTSEDDPNAENIVIDNEGPADALFV